MKCLCNCQRDYWCTDKANDFPCLLFMDLLHAWLQLSIARQMTTTILSIYRGCMCVWQFTFHAEMYTNVCYSCIWKLFGILNIILPSYRHLINDGNIANRIQFKITITSKGGLFLFCFTFVCHIYIYIYRYIISGIIHERIF